MRTLGYPGMHRTIESRLIQGTHGVENPTHPTLYPTLPYPPLHGWWDRLRTLEYPGFHRIVEYRVLEGTQGIENLRTPYYILYPTLSASTPVVGVGYEPWGNLDVQDISEYWELQGTQAMHCRKYSLFQGGTQGINTPELHCSVSHPTPTTCDGAFGRYKHGFHAV